MQSSITRMWRRYTIVGVIFSIALTGCPNPTSDSGDSPVLSDDDEWSYEVVGSAPIPGDNGVIDVSRSGDTYTFRFAEASDTETDREDLRYAAFTSSSEIIGQSVDLQYLVATSEVDPQWFEYGGFQISSLRGPIYFNVGVRDSDGNISAYQAVYVAPEPSAASYTVDPTVYENDDTIEINASDGSDIIYVVTNTLEGTTEHDTESIDSDWFSPEGSTSSEPLHDVTTDVYRGTLSGSSFSGGSAPRGIGLRGFPGQHNPLQMVDEPSEVGDDDSGADGSIVGSQLSGSAAIGSEESFSTHSGDLNATAVANATTGDWNLTVWLDNADTAGVTQAMIDAIVTRFMREGDENDIFDWVSGVYGDPWGEREDSRLISSDRRDVHILFYDIDGDGAPSQFQSRTVGYFWPKDNYAEGSQISDGTTGETVTSNGKLMFYMDSELLSIRDGASWDIEDFWPAEVVSTLAHEFQHMVHFYQRQVINGVASDTWLNEMASLVAEDIVSRAVGVSGPRGVDPAVGNAGGSGNPYGRMPGWSPERPVQLDTWSQSDPLPQYAASYSFGAALVRRFGVDVMTQLLQVSGDSRDAVEAAVAATRDDTVSFGRLLSDWGLAMLVSNDTSNDTGVSDELRVNTGGWLASSTNGTQYRVGSINAHNYTGGLRIVDYPSDASEFSESIPPAASVFVRMATGVSETYTDTLNLPASVSVRVVERLSE